MEIFIRNYAPAIQRFFLPMWESTHQKMETALIPFDKKKVKEATPLKDGRFVPITYVADGTTMEIYCNFYSGCVCRVRSEKLFFAGLEEKGLFVENLSDSSQSWTVRPFSDTGVQTDAHAEEIRANVYPGQRLLIPITEELSDVVLSLDGSYFAFHFGIREDWTEDPYNPEPAAFSKEEPFSLKQKTGLLTASHGGKVCFQELWPYLTSPYLFGTVNPDPGRRVTIRKETQYDVPKDAGDSACKTSFLGEDAGTVEAFQIRHGFRLERSYAITPEDVGIATVVMSEGGDEGQFDPVFALHIEDMDGSCEFCLKNGETIRKTFDYVRDLKIAHDEVILYEFVQEDYAAQEEERIVLHFAGSTWSLTTDRPFRAYLHSNYIFLRPLPSSLHPDGWAWKEGKADFGTIWIKKLNRQ